tara:strand:+ start:780 stop:1250 length:471 start_codon:yes stop_codon:yes gene_type:complete
MQQITYGRWKHTYEAGKKTEEHFKDLMISRGNECVKTSMKDDMLKHIDYYVNGFGVDVKGKRKLNSIWLEIVNVHGFTGWLKGEADFIVFDMLDLDAYSVFRRLELLELASNVTETTNNNKDYMKIYGRDQWGQKDKLIQYTFDHIKHLEVQRINY